MTQSTATGTAGVRSATASFAWLAILLALAAYFGLGAERLIEVWRTGAYHDTDDAMRMAQVRDLLAGQSWYDMTAWRLDPPNGMFSHWSRVVDAPLAALILLFGAVLDPAHAERAARIVFPALMTLGLFVAGLHAARIFAGRSMRLFGVAAMLFCGVLFWQFPAGRIDHHAPQIVALLAAVAAMAACFGRPDARGPAAWSGAMTALSLSIGLENLPFLALVAAAPAVLFVARGAEAREALLGYALGLAGALLPLYLATVGPQRWLVPACDALSAPYLFACLGGCAAYLAIARFGGGGVWMRLALVALAGVCAAAPLSLMPRACLSDPYFGMDALVRSYWLNPNPEVISILRQAQIDAQLALMLFVPTLVGLFAALFGAATTGGAARARWGFLAIQVALGLTLGCLHVRVFATVMPLAALGLLAPVAWSRQKLEAVASVETRPLIGGLAGLLILFGLSSMGLMIALPEDAFDAPPKPDRCMKSETYASLKTLPPGVAASMISPGAYLLAETDLSVLAGPYHRNNHGNRATLDILFAKPDAAENLARAKGVRYIILCWDRSDAAASWTRWGAGGLAEQIIEGAVPRWLRPIPMGDAPARVFEVVNPAAR